MKIYFSQVFYVISAFIIAGLFLVSLFFSRDILILGNAFFQRTFSFSREELLSFSINHSPRFLLDLDYWRRQPSLTALSDIEYQRYIATKDSKDILSRDNIPTFLSFFTGFARADNDALGTLVGTHLFDYQGKEVDVLFKTDVILNDSSLVSIVPDSDVRPGRYTLAVDIDFHGEMIRRQQDFTWGVVAMNTNQSEYRAGDHVRVGLAVLDDGGHTLCGADIEMNVRVGQKLIASRSTREETIVHSLDCGPKTVTNNPDYITGFMASITGVYDLDIRVHTKNGSRFFSDSFVVNEEIISPLLIERRGPTRIYPKEEYDFPITLVAQRDFSGYIEESLPDGFLLKRGQLKHAVHLKKGEKTTFIYRFKAPEISPELYLMNPLRIVESSSKEYIESRQWQIASDAIGSDGLIGYWKLDDIASSSVQDDEASGHSFTGSWTEFSDGTAYDSDAYYNAAGAGSDKSTWTFTSVPSGTYKVATRWVTHANRATNAPYTVYDNTTSLGTFTKNQEVEPDDFTYNSKTFEYISSGGFTITSGTLKVELTDNANEFVVADAVVYHNASTTDSSGENQHGNIVNVIEPETGTLPSLSFTNTKGARASSNRIDVGAYDNIEGASTISIAMWARQTTWHDAGYVNKDGDNVDLICQPWSDQKIYWQINTTANRAITNAAPFSLSTWYHVVCWYDGTNLKVYVNGSEAATSAKTTTIPADATTLQFLTNGDLPAANERFFSGKVDDIRLYNRALSTTEITALANGTHVTATWDGSSSNSWETAANWDINTIPDNYTNIIIPSVSTVYPRLASTTSVVNLDLKTSTTTLDLRGFNLTFNDSGAFNSTGTLMLIGTETLTNFTNDTNSGTVLIYGSSSDNGLATGNSYYNLSIEDANENGLLAYWKFDEGASTTAYDSAGIYPGTITGATWSTSTNATTTYYNPYSLSFDGTDDVVTVPDANSLDITGDITLAAWIKRSVIDNYGGIISKCSISTWNYDLYVRASGSNANQLALYSDNTTPTILFSTTTIGDTNWHHVLVTRSGTSVLFYIDGTQTPPTNTMSGSFGTSANGVEIGRDCDWDAGAEFSGNIDDARIYNRALSVDEVVRLAAGKYANGASSTATFTLSANLDVNNNLNLFSGILDASTSNYNITLGNNWNNYSSSTAFTARSATVTFDGVNQAINGSTSFYNFTKLETSNDSTTSTLTFEKGATTTISNIWLLDGLDANDLISLVSSVSGSRWVVNSQGTNTIDYTAVKDSYAITVISASNANNIDLGGNTNWTFSSGIDISGTVYIDEGSTPLGTVTVQAAVNGVNNGSTADTNGSGVYSLSTISAVAGDVVTLYLQDETEDAVLVTVTNGSTMTGMDLYQNKLIIRHDNSGSLKNTHLTSGAVASESDISNIYSMSVNNLTVQSGKELFIWSGHTFAPGATTTINDDIDINGTLTLATNSMTVYGNWDATGGTVTSTSGGTVTFAATSAKNVTSSGQSFTNVIFNGSGGSWLAKDAFVVLSTLTITNGTFDLNGNNLTNTGGSFSNDSVLKLRGSETLTGFTNDTNSGTTTYYGTTTFSSGLVAGDNYYHLQFNGVGGNWTLDSNFVVNGDLTITTGTLDASSTSNYAINVGKSWRNLGGSFNSRNATVTFDGTSGSYDIIPNKYDFNRLAISGSGGTWTLSDNLTATSTLTITGGTLDVSTSNYTMRVGTVIQTGGTLTSRSGTVIVTSSTNSNLAVTSSLYNLSIEDSTENGLVGYWKFDEGYSTSTKDWSGNNNLGTLVGGVAWSTSTNATTTYYNPYSLSFDGTDDAITVVDADSLDITGDITLAAWIKRSVIDNYGGIIAKCSAASQWNYELSVQDGAFNPNQLIFYSDNTTPTILYSTTTIGDTNWHHVLVTRSGTSVLFYIDGTQTPPTNTMSGSFGTSANGVEIGRDCDWNAKAEFSGNVDDARIYNRALSADEASNLAAGRYAAGHSGVTTFTLTANLDVASLTLQSGILDTGSRTLTVTQPFVLKSGHGSYTGGSATQTFNGGVTVNSSTFSGGSGTVDVNGALVIAGGSLTSTSGSLTVSGDFTHSGGTFTHNSGTVTLDGNNQIMTGTTTFNNLTKNNAGNVTLTFGANQTQTIVGTLTLEGISGSPLRLRSSVSGTRSKINPSGTRTIRRVDVQDSNNTNGTPIDCLNECLDSGNNLNWTVIAGSFSDSGLIGGGGGSQQTGGGSGGGSGTDGGGGGSGQTGGGSGGGGGVSSAVMIIDYFGYAGFFALLGFLGLLFGWFIPRK